MTTYDELTNAMIQKLENQGLQAEAQLIRQDHLLMRMAELMTQSMDKMASLQIDSAAKLQVGGVVLTAIPQLSVLIGEMREEGKRTKGLIDFALKGTN